MRTWVAAALVLLAGCVGDRPEEVVPPEEEPSEEFSEVVMSLDAEPDEARAGEEVVVRAEVANLGPRPVYYRVECAAGEPVVAFTLLTPRGVPIRFEPDTIACPEVGPAELAVGEVVNATLTYNGTLEGEAGVPPSGTYVVIASMHWWPDPVDIGEANYTTTYRAYESARFVWLGESAPEAVDLAIRADPDAARPGETVLVNATATNVGDASVWFESGCDTAMAIDTYRNGDRVASTWPNASCDERVPEELPPGASVSTEIAWTVEEGTEGPLTFVARFQYWNAEAADELPEAIGTGVLVRVLR